jgi:holo-[acyl-carrier protein] synthase
MIYGIGTDIVDVTRIQRSLARHGERLARRILAPEEFDAFQRDPRPVPFLAKRFAAKEAAAKALGTGFREGLALRDIVVGRDPRGRPLLYWRGRGAELCAQFGVGASHLSLADEQGYAVAHVVLERR